MTPRILTACAIAALTVGTEARAQTLPAWSPQTICTQDATPEHCGFLEGQARKQISQQWQFIPTLVRERCLASTGEEETQSWRLFGECLATAARPPQGGTQVAQVSSSGSQVVVDNGVDVEAMRAELVAAQQRMQELDAAREASAQQQLDAEAMVAGLKADLERAETLRIANEAEIADIRAQLTAAMTAQASVSSESDAEMAQMRSSLDEAMARADAAELRATGLQESLATALANAEAMGEAVSETENARIAELEEALEKSDADARLGSVRIEGLQTRLLEMSDAANVETVPTDESSTDSGMARAEALEASLATAETENEQNVARIDGLRSRIVELTEALLTEEPAEPEADLNAAARIAELEASLAQAEAGAADLQAQVTELTSAAAADASAGVGEEAEEQAARIADLEASLETAETEVKRSNTRIEGLQERLVEAIHSAAASDEPDDRDARIADLEASLAYAQSEVDRAAGRIEGLQGRLIAARDAAAQSNAAVGDAAGDLEEKNARIAALEDDLAKAQSEMRNRDVRIEGLQQRLMEAADTQVAAVDTGDLAGQLDVAESRVANLVTRLRNARDAGKTVESEKTRIEGELEEARSRIAALQADMAEGRTETEDQVAAQNAARDEAIAASRRLEILLENQRERSARVADTVAEQRSRIGELEAEVDALRNPVQVVQSLPSCKQRIDDVVSEGGIQFGNNKAEIRADAARTIDQLIVIARDCENARLTVRGHTDALGERSYNLYLSQLRADAVVDYMERNGVSPDRVDGVGVGPDEPVADNGTRAGRAANRRIEILVQ